MHAGYLWPSSIYAFLLSFSKHFQLHFKKGHYADNDFIKGRNMAYHHLIVNKTHIQSRNIYNLVFAGPESHSTGIQYENNNDFLLKLVTCYNIYSI